MRYQFKSAATGEVIEVSDHADLTAAAKRGKELRSHGHVLINPAPDEPKAPKAPKATKAAGKGNKGK